MKKAFTLVELLIALGMFAMLFMVVSDVLGSIMRTRVISSAENEIARESSWILTRMGYDVSRADAIIFPEAGSSSDNLVLMINGNPYTYKVFNEKLVFGESGSEEPIIDEGVKIVDLTITRMQDLAGKANVQINLTLVSTARIAGGITPTRQLVTTYALR